MKKYSTFFLFLLAIVGILWYHPNGLLAQRVVGSMIPQNFIAQTPSSGITPPKPKEEPRQEQILKEMATMQKPSLITQGAVLTILSLLPFIVMILTSFMKLVIVLSLLRNALGVQQAPPNQIINGVGLMLTLFIMYPTAVEMYETSQKAVAELDTPDSLISPGSSTYILTISQAVQEPLRNFLKNNSSVRHRAMFYRMAYKVLPEKYRPDLKPEDFIIVVPSFVTSQLKDAFEIGVLIYIPFFVIDLVTSNVLLAMGMMMLSPVTISMPLKLFLLVMLDGWTLLIEGLVNTFR